ncbi:MAG TPA: hypothetical protein VFS21_19715 [Roseiflexaceae bacterium]|nr:hypothetical protein [Roseiflexaceae bacterium]
MLISDVSACALEPGPPVPAVGPELALLNELLCDLEAVGWGRLRHAYGPADDVPALLCGLLIREAEPREDVFATLFSTIWHQGTVYDSSARAVPFLLRLLADPRTPDRIGVLHLLSALAAAGAIPPTAMPEESRPDADALATNAAVANGVNLLLALAGDNQQSAEVCRLALYTLSLLPAAAPTSVPRLLAWLDDPDQSDLQPDIARALHALLDNGPDARAVFTRLLQCGDDPVTAFVAAAALLVRAGSDAPDAAVRALLGGLHGVQTIFPAAPPGDPVGYWFWDSPWPEDVATFALEHLCAPGGDFSRRALLRMLPLVRQPEQAEGVALRLLDLAFGDGQSRRWHATHTRRNGRRTITYRLPDGLPARDPRTLTPPQREVLHALLGHDPLWQHDSNLLELYGLPSSRSVLGEIIEK